ncbi:MAG: hypothetical protein WBN53_06665 [Thermodesulfobacteriota bacterium]
MDRLPAGGIKKKIQGRIFEVGVQNWVEKVNAKEMQLTPMLFEPLLTMAEAGRGGSK